MKVGGIVLVISVVGALLLGGCGGGEAEIATPTGPTATPVPTLPPSGVEVGAGEYTVGDTVSFSNHTFTLNSFERNDLLVVNVTFENLTVRNFVLDPSQLFDAFDSEGNRLEFHAKDDDPDALAGTLVKGFPLTGNVYFDISPDQKGITLHYHASQMGLALAGTMEFKLD